jgi:hypothetical protein
VVGIVLAAAAFRIAQIGTDLRSAKNELEAAEAMLKAGQPAAARAALSRGNQRVAHANSVVHGSPELSVLELIPVARQNLAALKTSVSVALRLAGGGRRLLDIAQPLEASNGQFEVPLRKGAVPLPVLQQLAPHLDDLRGNLPVVADRPRSSLLLPPVRELVDTVFRQSDLRKRQLGTIADGITLLKALSGETGGHRLFIAVANAAEMRGTGGMILSYGELVGDRGQLALERFGGIDEIALPAPANVDVASDYLDRFGALGPTLNWRNANLGVDFTALAPVMAAMYQEATGKVADAVLQIDSAGLAALMKGTGPVEVAGLGTVTADNVVEVTLSSAYARFSNRAQRQEVLGDVAEAVFRKLVTGDYPSLRPLATALVDAAAERRVLLHMATGEARRTVSELGVGGALPAPGRDFATLTVQNFSANKLDYYLDTSVRLTGARVPGRVGRVQAEVTITNTARPGQTSPPYVYGPNVTGQRAGLYVGLATLYLPKGTGLVGQSGDLGDNRASVVTEHDRAAVSFPFRLEAGQSRRVVLDLTLAPAAGAGYGFDLVPISRVRPTVFTVDLARADGEDRVRFTGPLTRPVVLSPRGG